MKNDVTLQKNHRLLRSHIPIVMLLEFWRSFFSLVFKSIAILLCIIFKPLALHMPDQIIMHSAVLV
jgi:hypothetical protein